MDIKKDGEGYMKLTEEEVQDFMDEMDERLEPYVKADKAVTPEVFKEMFNDFLPRDTRVFQPDGDSFLELMQDACLDRLIGKFEAYFEENDLPKDYQFVRPVEDGKYMFTTHLFAFYYQEKPYILEQIYGQGESIRRIFNHDIINQGDEKWFQELGNFLFLNDDFSIEKTLDSECMVRDLHVGYYYFDKDKEGTNTPEYIGIGDLAYNIIPENVALAIPEALRSLCYTGISVNENALLEHMKNFSENDISDYVKKHEDKVLKVLENGYCWMDSDSHSLHSGKSLKEEMNTDWRA